MPCFDHAGGRNSIQERDVDVHQDNMGLKGACTHDRILAGHRFPDDEHVRKGLKDRSQRPAKKWMVLDKQDSDRTGQRHGGQYSLIGNVISILHSYGLGTATI
jgi:hypothetical protein